MALTSAAGKAASHSHRQPAALLFLQSSEARGVGRCVRCRAGGVRAPEPASTGSPRRWRPPRTGSVGARPSLRGVTQRDATRRNVTQRAAARRCRDRSPERRGLPGGSSESPRAGGPVRTRPPVYVRRRLCLRGDCCLSLHWERLVVEAQGTFSAASPEPVWEGKCINHLSVRGKLLFNIISTEALKHRSIPFDF